MTATARAGTGPRRPFRTPASHRRSRAPPRQIRATPFGIAHHSRDGIRRPHELPCGPSTSALVTGDGGHELVEGVGGQREPGQFGGRPHQVHGVSKWRTPARERALCARELVACDWPRLSYRIELREDVFDRVGGRVALHAGVARKRAARAAEVETRPGAVGIAFGFA